MSRARHIFAGYRRAMNPRPLALIAAVVLLPALPATAATQGVRVGSFYFDAASAGDNRVVVDVGDRIAFTFEGRSAHTATVDGLFDSGDRSAGETYTTMALMQAGTYDLYCKVHGPQQHGARLLVRPAGGPSPSPSRAAASPSPAPSPVRSVAPSPAPVRTSAAPRRLPSPSPSVVRGASPLGSPSTVIAAPRTSPSPLPPVAEPSPSPSPAAAADRPASSTQDGGSGWLLPTLLVVLALLAGAVAAALAARRRRPTDLA